MVCLLEPSRKGNRGKREPACGVAHFRRTMAAPLPVLINRLGGTAAALGSGLEGAVRGAFARLGRSIILEILEGSEMAGAIRRHADAPVIAVGGGDGTLGGAAQVLHGARAALAILPLGTRNHLARTLGIPTDLTEAATVAATGERRRIDLGGAGGRVFVNNASIGLYPRLVRARDRRDLPKWLGTVGAAWEVLHTMRADRYHLTVDGEKRVVKTPLLFVGNNHYSLELGSLGIRESLGEGKLSLCAIRAESPLQLVLLVAKVLLGLAAPATDFENLAEAQSVTVEGEGEIGVALDGEVVRMTLPLTLDILPAALGVVAPRVAAGRESLFSRTH